MPLTVSEAVISSAGRIPRHRSGSASTSIQTHVDMLTLAQAGNMPRLGQGWPTASGLRAVILCSARRAIALANPPNIQACTGYSPYQ